ncbi:MAG: diguanylate cyclase [Alphaproteobacteria bacterium]|jgi:GGDEF domain-containing protein|nr:diguanylate cyclase [Alphaproteobacteria bacterium]
MPKDALDLLLVGGDPALSQRLGALAGEGRTDRARLRTVGEVGEVMALVDRGNVDVVLYAIDDGAESALEAVTALDLAAPEVTIVVIADGTDLALGEQALAVGAQDVLGREQLTAAAFWRSIRFALGRKQRVSRLAERALRDPLTGLPNRTLLCDRLANMAARARRNGTLRRGDTVARLGGDEFVVALDDIREAADADEFGRTIGCLIAEPFRIDGMVAQVSASVGVALLGTGGDDVDSLVQSADQAMYQVKRGKGPRPSNHA